MTKEYILKWVRKAGVRAIKTVAQTMVGMLSGELLGIMEVDWVAVLSVGAMAGIVSLLTSLAGIPEMDEPIEINE